MDHKWSRAAQCGRLTTAVAAIGLACWAAPAVRAEVLQINASIETSVQEYSKGEEASFSVEYGVLGETAPDLPLEVTAALGYFLEETGGSHGGQAIASFADPTLSETPNPQEFGLEVVCFSGEPATHYEVFAKGLEVREVLFDPVELGVPTLGDENLVNSAVFISGAIVIWSEGASPNLAELSAEFEFEVVQDLGDLATNGAEVVFTTSVFVDGDSNGEVAVTQFGAIGSLLGGPEVLLEADGPDIDAIVAELEAVGRVHVLLIPEQTINYPYFARAGEAFELQAEARLEALNLPSGTGVAAVFGRPFVQLGAAISPVLPPGSGARVQAAVNRAIRKAEIPADEPAASIPAAGICGVLGAEAPLGMALALFGFWIRPRR